MTEEKPKDSNIKSTIDAVTGLVKAVPIYDDAIQPSAKQLGKSLETATRAVNLALSPLRAMIWGFEQIESWLSKRVAQKLSNVPEENIVTPTLNVAAPAIQALRYVANDLTLRELFANLLASSMNKETSHLAHPAYVEVLKNICTDEAVILQKFVTEEDFPTINLTGADQDGRAYYSYYTNFTPFHKLTAINRVDLIPAYIDNLCRLGLTQQPGGWVYTDDPDEYDKLFDDNFLESYKNEIVTSNLTPSVDHRILSLTSFGRQFVDNVVKDSESAN